MRLLFVTWDGPQVSYVEGLFLPIFRGLKPFGIQVDILQFRWGSADEEERVRQACAAAGCGYRAVRIGRWGGGAGPFISALAGGRKVRAAVRHFKSDMIMPRSLMPAIAVLAAGADDLPPIIFDADGLAADERVEVGGLSATSLTYRMLRDVEAQIVRRSTKVITRTQASAEILFHRAGPPVAPSRFAVVSNGRDDRHFHPEDAEGRAVVRSRLNLDQSAPLLVYAGSVGPQYRLDAVKSLFAEILRLRADSRLLFLTGQPELAARELEQPRALVMRVPPDEVPAYLAAGDAGLAYRTTGFAMQGVAPIKLSEYLLCGTPVVGTAGVGNTAAAISEGVFLDDQTGSAAAAKWVVDQVLPKREEFRAKARSIGVEHYSLASTVEEYRRAISGGPSASGA